MPKVLIEKIAETQYDKTEHQAGCSFLREVDHPVYGRVPKVQKSQGWYKTFTKSGTPVCPVCKAIAQSEY